MKCVVDMVLCKLLYLEQGDEWKENIFTGCPGQLKQMNRRKERSGEHKCSLWFHVLRFPFLLLHMDPIYIYFITFFITAVANFHKFNDKKTPTSLSFYRSGGQKSKSRCQQDCSPPEALRAESVSLIFFQLPEATCIPFLWSFSHLVIQTSTTDWPSSSPLTNTTKDYIGSNRIIQNNFLLSILLTWSTHSILPGKEAYSQVSGIQT